MHKKAIGMAYPMNLKSNRQMRATLGVSEKYFKIIVNAFEKAHKNKFFERYITGIEHELRKRIPGGGCKGKLPTSADKVAFCLYFLKAYPTYDDLANRFSMGTSTAHESIERLLPILHQALIDLEVMPDESYQSGQQMKEHLKKKACLL
jgi:hypothetical protein